MEYQSILESFACWTFILKYVKIGFIMLQL